eukprot:gene32938-42625_t
MNVIISVAVAPGFIPSTVGLFISWLFMLSTGLLIAEVNCQLKSVSNNSNDGVDSADGLLAMTRTLLGNVNNFLVLVVLASFGGLVSLQIPGLQPSQLLHPQDYGAVLPAVPVMFVALVYHNIVPTICSALKYDRMKITIALTAGTFIPLLMFVVNIGSISSSRFLVQLFSEAAIVTSFIGFVIGLIGLLARESSSPKKGDDAQDSNRYTTFIPGGSPSLLALT